jgi:hypothetical protein
MNGLSVYIDIDMDMISDSLLSSLLHTAIPIHTNTHTLKIEKALMVFSTHTSHTNINIHSRRLL